MCGKDWPHPGVLSSAPTCDHCVQDLKRNLKELQRSILITEKHEPPLTDLNPAPWWATTTPKIKVPDFGLSASDSILRRRLQVQKRRDQDSPLSYMLKGVFTSFHGG